MKVCLILFHFLLYFSNFFLVASLFDYDEQDDNFPTLSKLVRSSHTILTIRYIEN